MAEEKRHAIKLETNLTLGPEKSDFSLEKRRAAIKAALHAAVSGLAATTSGLATQVGRLADDVPWGEVIVGPIWEQRGPVEDGTRMQQVAELFWE